MREHALPEPPIAPGTIVYSSFWPAEPPEVWPVVGSSHGWLLGALAAFILAAFAAGLGITPKLSHLFPAGSIKLPGGKPNQRTIS